MLKAYLSRGPWHRAVFVSVLVALPFWGPLLLPMYTFSPSAANPSIRPDCRAGGADLQCAAPYHGLPHADSLAPAAVEMPASYLHSDGYHLWNPYIGSGYPEILDGHNSRYSPSRYLLTFMPGDQGRDVITFIRVVVWSVGICLLADLLGATILALGFVAFGAVLAPHFTGLVDHPVLEAGLLAPWFLVIVLAAKQRRIRFAMALGAALALGVLAGCLSFLQSQFTLAMMVGVQALAAAYATRGRSLAMGLMVACGFGLTYFAWSPMILHLGDFWSTREYFACVAEHHMGLLGAWESMHWGTFQVIRPDSMGTLAAIAFALVLLVRAPYRFVSISWLLASALFVFGVPFACSLPINGVDFYRHLAPHMQAPLIALVGVTLERFAIAKADRLSVVLVVLVVVARLVFAPSIKQPEPWLDLLFGAVFLLAATRFDLWWVRLPALASLLLVSMAFNSRVFAGGFAKQVPPLAKTMSDATVFGPLQRLSQEGDKRHFSTDEILFPNWSGALRILDMRILPALQPLYLNKLNLSAKDLWANDGSQGDTLPAYIGTKPREAMFDERFARLLALHRVSLFTFHKRVLTASQGPYSRCSTVSAIEPFFLVDCPEVPSVGSFPKTVSVSGSDSQTMAMVGQATVESLATTAIISRSDTLGDLAPGDGVVRNVERGLSSLHYEVTVSKPGYFYIADTYFPGWSATVNGRAVPIERANMAFKAVFLPVGDVALQLSFVP